MARRKATKAAGPLRHGDIGPDEVREYRTARGTTFTTNDGTVWTQAIDTLQAAQTFHVSRSTWTRWESGVSRPPAFVRAIIAETINDYRETLEADA